MSLKIPFPKRINNKIRPKTAPNNKIPKVLEEVAKEKVKEFMRTFKNVKITYLTIAFNQLRTGANFTGITSKKYLAACWANDFNCCEYPQSVPLKKIVSFIPEVTCG